MDILLNKKTRQAKKIDLNKNFKSNSLTKSIIKTIM